MSDIKYEIRRVGNANPAVLQSSARTHPISNQLGNQCRSALGLARSPSALNFYDFNRCKGINSSGFVSAVYGHEGSGYNGGAGHYGLAIKAAQLPANDPYTAIEPLAFGTLLDLQREIDTRVIPVADAITNASADPNPTGNWPGGQIWFWNPASSSFAQYNLNGF